jgi:hypothetical protein
MSSPLSRFNSRLSSRLKHQLTTGSFTALVALFLLGVASLPCQANYPKVEDESLVEVLKKIDRLELIQEPENHRPQDSIIDAIYRLDGAQRDRYRVYLTKVEPLYDNLMQVRQRVLEQPGTPLTLQL